MGWKLAVENRRRAGIALIATLAMVIAACGGGTESDGADDGPSEAGNGDSQDSNPIGDRVPGEGDYVLTSPVTPGEIVVFSAEAEAGLEAMEEYLRDRNPEASGDAQCWLMQQDDDTIAQAMRCGPYVEPNGTENWASYPFASDDAAQTEGRLELRYESRLIGEVEPFIGSVELIRPDGLEAPEDAYSDVVEETRVSTPEAPQDCTATGTITDDVYGTFDLAEADFLEVEATVNDSNLDEYSYLHSHVISSWNDTEGRGVRLGIRLVGMPGEEEVQSVSIDLDISNRQIMEGGGSGNPESVDQSDLPADLVSSYDSADGGTIAADLTIPGRYSYDEDNRAVTDVTITCG